MKSRVFRQTSINGVVYKHFPKNLSVKMLTLNLEEKNPVACHILYLKIKSFYVNILLKVNIMSIYTAIEQC